jgi:hypothetical protein
MLTQLISWRGEEDFKYHKMAENVLEDKADNLHVTADKKYIRECET